MYFTLLSNSVMAANFTMYCLENITDYFAFEQLCHDLMVLEGYSSIEPLGGFSDKGRDAIHVSQSRETTIFAYSVREDWRKKLDEDAEKIYKHRHNCDQLVFITTAKFTAGERDRAIKDIRDKFAWNLQLFGAERLRILLEAKHPKVKVKYPQIFPPDFLNNQSELTRLSEHFTKAIEQLANPEITVRLGGIYALEQIAKNFKDDHWTIMEVLTAFVREKCPLKKEEEGARKQLPKIPTDIQAALTVIGRRDIEKDPENQKLDLSRVNIAGANLREAQLQGANLYQANLRGTDLTKAQLRGADLGNTNLQQAHIIEANLQGAILTEANLKGAFLNGTNLQQADLMAAILEGAQLSSADLRKSLLKLANLQSTRLCNAQLQGADIRRADFSGASLLDANLEGAFINLADFRNAYQLTQQQIDSAQGQARLPDYLKIE
jgi:hypothetical protein